MIEQTHKQCGLCSLFPCVVAKRFPHGVTADHAAVCGLGCGFLYNAVRLRTVDGMLPVGIFAKKIITFLRKTVIHVPLQSRFCIFIERNIISFSGFLFKYKQMIPETLCVKIIDIGPLQL